MLAWKMRNVVDSLNIVGNEKTKDYGTDFEHPEWSYLRKHLKDKEACLIAPQVPFYCHYGVVTNRGLYAKLSLLERECYK